MRRPGWLVRVVAVGAGAREAELPRPMTAADVANFGSGETLVTCLGQRDASPSGVVRIEVSHGP